MSAVTDAEGPGSRKSASTTGRSFRLVARILEHKLELVDRRADGYGLRDDDQARSADRSCGRKV